MQFAKRNLKIFFRDKTAVFFSLLSSLIVLSLYVLFLGDMIKSGPLAENPHYEVLVDAWLIAGLVCVTTVTSVLGVLGNRVTDISNKVVKDFVASPVKQSHLTLGYLISAIIVGIILSSAIFIFGFLYMLSNGASFYSAQTFLLIMFYVILSIISSVGIVFFIVTFVKSEAAFSTVTSLIGTLIGFLAGIYIPIGNLPSGVGIIIKLFPPAHAASLLRQAMMADYLDLVFEGAPAEAMESFNSQLGVVYKIGELEITSAMSVAFILVISSLFFGLSILNLRKKQK